MGLASISEECLTMVFIDCTRWARIRRCLSGNSQIAMSKQITCCEKRDTAFCSGRNFGSMLRSAYQVTTSTLSQSRRRWLGHGAAEPFTPYIGTSGRGWREAPGEGEFYCEIDFTLENYEVYETVLRYYRTASIRVSRRNRFREDRIEVEL